MQTRGLLLRCKQKLHSLKDTYQPVNQCFQMFLYLGVINFYATTQKAVTSDTTTDNLLWSVDLLLSTAIRTLLKHIRAEVQLENFWGGSESCACECGLWAWHDQGVPTDYFKKLWMYSNSGQSVFRRISWVNYTVSDSLNPRRMLMEIKKSISFHPRPWLWFA